MERGKEEGREGEGNSEREREIEGRRGGKEGEGAPCRSA